MDDRITSAHGGGGEKYRELVREVFLPAYSNEYIEPLGDSAVLTGARKIAFTTDCYVVKPLFFPGGDIGSLAVSGTVNDLAVSAAVPKYISVGMIIEAGFEMQVLKKIVSSISNTAKKAKISVVTGDTKVIESERGDGIFINTAGVGIFPEGRSVPPQKIEAGDRIIISGHIASHGTAVLLEREKIRFSNKIKSDAAPLNRLVERALKRGQNAVHAMRDPTRGGVAAVLNEWATPDTDIVLYGEAGLARPDVSAVCGILGLDPLIVANEGVIMFAVAKEFAQSVLDSIKKDHNGKDAVIAGEVRKGTGSVYSATEFGSYRKIITPRGELLPRIC